MLFLGLPPATTPATSEPSGNLLPKASPDEQKTAYKAAELFSTNRTNKRRNLTSSQWAAIAVEAEEILAAIAVAVESERRTKISEARQAETTQLIEPSPEKNERSSHAKAAEPITQLIVEQPREKREAGRVTCGNP